MCGRYALFDFKDYPARYNVAPGSLMPIVINADGSRAVEVMKWGLVPFWAKDPRIGYKMINARAESVSSKPAYRQAFVRTRCLVPANGFFEWQKIQVKQPYYFHLKDRNFFQFAGLYDVWIDAEGHKKKTYTILTTSANEIMAPIHDRMPVVMKKEDEEKWLDSSMDKNHLEKLLVPYAALEMEVYPVSSDINYPANEGVQLVTPVTIEGRFK